MSEAPIWWASTWEGPYISPRKVGAQNPKYVMAADAGMFRRLQARSGGLIRLVDIAPEEPGNLDFIRECHNEVRISIAHTCTDYETAKEAFAAGASHMTHPVQRHARHHPP